MDRECYSFVAPLLNNFLIKNIEHTFLSSLTKRILYFLWPSACVYVCIHRRNSAKVNNERGQRNEMSWRTESNSKYIFSLHLSCYSVFIHLMIRIPSFFERERATTNNINAFIVYFIGFNCTCNKCTFISLVVAAFLCHLLSVSLFIVLSVFCLFQLICVFVCIVQLMHSFKE